MQEALISEPEAGAVIRGPGGVRKLRWAARGRGKRGGEFKFTNPTGIRIPAAPQSRFSGDVFELVSHNTENDIIITPKSPVPNWGGEGMDVDIVVHHLYLKS